MEYQELDDEGLVSLLFTEEDRLPMDAVDEFLRRGEQMIKPLSGIVSNGYSWNKELPEWWSVVHATFILGAIGGKESVLPLLKALRFAIAYDCDWVAERLPSIFGKVGVQAMDGLKLISKDKTSDWYTRVSAMESLAAVTIANPEIEEEVFMFLSSIFEDKEEERDTRQFVGNVLLDFKREDLRESLFLFAGMEKELNEKDAYYPAVFYENDVEKAFAVPEKNLWHYTLDWLYFYDENEISTRQERWEQEDRKLAREKEEGEISSSGPVPFVYNKPKVGRNEPCPCGSGKKYKKCCG
ncbi:MAG: SEC-C metal-binding domain-containing protein [Nitrospirota bacterium]|nr:SEC-C metal-binding domain-containing protein [Nitrospirota bacterium]